MTARASPTHDSQHLELAPGKPGKTTLRFLGVRYQSLETFVLLVLILPFVSLLLFAFLPFDPAFFAYLIILLVCMMLYRQI